MIKAIFFDLGNTLTISPSLVDAMVDLAGSPLAQELNLSPAQLMGLGQAIQGFIANLYHDPACLQADWRSVWGEAAGCLGRPLDDRQVERLTRAHLGAFVARNRLQPYSLPLLSALHQAHIPLGLVSNVTGPADIFAASLGDMGLARFFDAIVWSCAVHYRKPDPHIYQLALNALRLPAGKDVWMVGDSEPADVLGGQAMGFTTVKIIDAGDSRQSAADYVVDRDEVLPLFERLLR